MSINFKTPQNSWLCHNARPAEQKGLYLLFVQRKGIAVEKLAELVERYYDTKVGIKKNKYWQRPALDYVSADFENFVKFVAEETKVKFEERPQRQSWDDYWQQCNMDGSFAYNGVTDDF